MKRRTLTAAAVARYKPKAQRYEISDTTKGLRLVVEPSGSKRWTFRFRRPNGKSADMRLGAVDVSSKPSEVGHRQRIKLFETRIKFLETENKQLRETLLACGQKPPEAPVLEAPVSQRPKIGDVLTLAQARVLATEVELQRSQGIDPAAAKQFEKRQRRVVTAEQQANSFVAAACQFCDKHTVRGRKPRSWSRVARHLGLIYPENGGEPTIAPKSLADRWRDRSLASITSHDVHAAIIEAHERGIPGMGTRGRGESDARARKMRDALGALFAWYSKHKDPRQRIAVDPARGAWRPETSRARERTLNTNPKERGADELKWFWKATDGVGKPYGVALKLLLLTGCRLREIAELRRRELNDDFSVLTLPSSRTKNGREHKISLPPLAQRILRSVPGIEGCDYMLSSNGRTPVGSWSKIKRQLDAAMLAEAKKEHGDDAVIEHFTLHDIRRSVATGLADLGVRWDVIEQVLNHQSGTRAGVAGVYVRSTLEPEKKAALERWARHVEGLTSPSKSATVTDLDSARRA